jgi:hypothetical protein
MAANYRYWCRECRYRTPWLTDSQGAQQRLDHYAQRHPGIPSGGRIEVRDDPNNGIGCLLLVGLLFLILLVASTCQYQSTSPPTSTTCQSCLGLRGTGSQPRSHAYNRQ